MLVHSQSSAQLFLLKPTSRGRPSAGWAVSNPLPFPQRDTVLQVSGAPACARERMQLGSFAVACADVSWRRRDDPAKVGLFVVRAADTTRFLNASLVSNASAIIGTVCFVCAQRGARAPLPSTNIRLSTSSMAAQAPTTAASSARVPRSPPPLCSGPAAAGSCRAYRVLLLLR